MTTDAPTSPDLLSRTNRFFLVMSGLFLIAGFGLALMVDPDPRGYGTHQQFGLPPCTFQSVMGISCPSCGGTTCFAHFARGQWTSAAQSNPAVFAFAMVCLLAIPWSFYSSWRGELYGVNDLNLCAVWLLSILGGFALLTWVFRIMMNSV